MRNGQNKRMRGRNHHRKNQNPMSRVFESNGPDVKIRGNPAHIAEKYIQLARDAQASGDPVSAENYYQHAEHYYRLIAAAQEQFRQNNPHLARPDTDIVGGRDDMLDDDEDAANGAGEEMPFGTREPQPFLPRDAQPFPQHQQHNSQQHNAPRQGHSNQSNGTDANEVDRLPSFITGASQPQQQPQQNNGPNGHDTQSDRFPTHRRRRRYRGPRQDFQGGQQSGGGNDVDDPTRGE